MLTFFYFSLGTIIGSFLTLVAQRVPKGQSIIWPASHCENCQQTLRWFELIPIISSLYAGHSCRYCQHKYGMNYLISEVCYGLLFAILVPQEAFTVLYWLCLALILAISDRCYFILEPKIFISGTVILWLAQFSQRMTWHWLTLFYCASLFMILYLLFRDKFGLGDVWLLLSWAPWLSFRDFSLLLVIASFSGLIAFFIFRKTKELPFIPFLFIGLAFILLT